MMSAWIQDIQYGEEGHNSNTSNGAHWSDLAEEVRIADIHFSFGGLEPGEEIGHTHAEAELFYVLCGSGEAVWGEVGQMVRGELHSGSALYVLPGTYHLIRNTGKRSLEGLLYHASPRDRGTATETDYEVCLLSEAREVNV